MPDWLGNNINWNYVPAICSADSFYFYGGGLGSENINGGAYRLNDVHYQDTSDQGWHVAGMETDSLFEFSLEKAGGVGLVLSGRKPHLKESLWFPPSPYKVDRKAALGPLKGHVEAGLAPLIGYDGDHFSIGFFGDLAGEGGAGDCGGGGGGGAGWSLTFSSAASCAAQ